MKGKIRVVPVGTKVLVGGNIEAQITGISIRGAGENYVTYEVSWWDDRQSKSAWLQEFEFKPAGEFGGFRSIGFHNGSKDRKGQP